MCPAARLEAAGLVVAFAKRADRLAHSIALVHDGREQVVLESIEGTPDQPWPPSPALQELHVEVRPGHRRLALLVGMAGTSHFSASVEIEPATGRIVFDVACRVREVPKCLASTYRVLAPAGIERVSSPTMAVNQAVRCVSPLGALGVELLAIDEPGAQEQWSLRAYSRTLSPGGRGQGEGEVFGQALSPGACEVAIVPADRSGPLPETIRWRYAIRCER